MDKFTKVVKTQNTEVNNDEQNTVYENDYMQVKVIDDYSFVIESDRIVVLPYVKDEGFVYLRSENIPPWTFKYKDQPLGKTSQFLTVISGAIENGETPENTLRRELYEEAGIAINQFFDFNIEGPFFESKGNSSQFYICLMELNYTEFKILSAPGDGTKLESIAKTLRVSISDLDEIRINDMATKLLIDKLKHEYNL